jgi:hypothetical protein
LKFFREGLLTERSEVRLLYEGGEPSKAREERIVDYRIKKYL